MRKVCQRDSKVNFDMINRVKIHFWKKDKSEIDVARIDYWVDEKMEREKEQRIEATWEREVKAPKVWESLGYHMWAMVK